MAGKAGAGDGERAYLELACRAGELGALDPLNDERLEDGLSIGGGGNMACEGVLATEGVGVATEGAGVIRAECVFVESSR